MFFYIIIFRATNNIGFTYGHQDIELIKNGHEIFVTDENKKLYIERIT